MKDQYSAGDARQLVTNVSVSKLGQWTRCQQQFEFTYLEGLRRPPSAAIALGNAFDRTATSAYLDRMFLGSLPGSEELDGTFASIFEEEACQVEDWEDNDRGKMLDSGIEITREWKARVAIHVDPLRCQEPIEVKVGEVDKKAQDECAALGIEPEFKIIGFADLRGRTRTKDGGTKEFIADHKVGKKAWGDADIVKSLQAVAYTLGSGLPEFQLHVGRRMSKGIKFDVLARQVHPAEHEALIRRVQIARRQMANAVRTGDFLPNREHQLCSQRWCGFWRECVAKHGGLVAE